jgi:RHS repeat-associated protein
VAGSAATFSFGTQSDYNDSPYGAPIRTISSTVNTLAGSSLSSTRKVFDTGVIPASGGTGAVSANPLLAGRLYSQTNPDGTRISAAYSVGDWTSYLAGSSITLWDNYTFTPNYSTGVWRAETYFQGNSTAVAGADSTPVSSWRGHAIEPVYLTPWRSTRRDVYTQFNGGLVQEITSIYTGSGNYKVIAWTQSDYAKGLLIDRFDSTGAREDRSYIAGRLVSEIHADGTQTQYTLDALYRVSRAQRKGVSATAGFPAQGDINTDYTYNAADQVLTTTTAPAAGGLSLTTSATYNAAGQILTSVDARNLTTSFAYFNGGRKVTITAPGGATKTTDRWIDGSLKSIDGTAVVAEYHKTDVNTADGTLTAAAYTLQASDFAAQTSAPRWSKATTDWAGRTIKEERPAPIGASPTTFTKQYAYNASGQLIKGTETGVADTLYQYDGQGALQYSGLDINANGSLDLAGPDRVTQTRTQVYNDTSAGVWYAQNLTYVYNQDSSSTALLQSEKLTRLVPYIGSSADFGNRKVYAETRVYDVFRNLTVQSVVTDRSTRLSTVTTNVSDSSVDDVVTSLNGLPVAHQTAQNFTSCSYYDALNRLVKATDPRTDTSSTARIGYYTTGTGQIGQVAWRQDSAGNQTSYTYESTTGRLATETNPLGKVARYSYTTRGELYRTWGDTAYPVEYAYNDYGERTGMNTFRGGSGWAGTTWPASPGTSDATTWDFHDATGTLKSKKDAANNLVQYTYDTRGQLKTRTWARGVTTTYSYSSTTAELTGISYSDGTPTLSYTYNRLGQSATVGDFTGTRSFNYSTTTTQLLQEDLGSFVGSRSVTYAYDTTGTGTKGRLNYLGVGLTSSPGGEYNITYGYDTYGRMNQVWTFTYSYLANSNLIAGITDSASNWSQGRTYESNRDLLTGIATSWSSTSKAAFGYANDTLGRRTAIAKTGEMFSRYSTNGLDTYYGYNDRSEVISEQTKLGGTATLLTGRDDAYAFDNIGNRSGAAGTPPGTTHNGTTANYTTNSLNQYTQRAVAGKVDVAGLAPSSATVTVNSSSSGVTRQNDWYFQGLGVTNSSTAVWQSITVASSLGGSSTRNAFVAMNPESFSYDLDGNLTSDGRWDYVYDAENRLVSMQSRAALSPGILPNAEARRIEFKYDYIGRRVEKIVRAGYNGTVFTTVVSDLKFVYDGWNLIYELDAANSLAKVRAYVWGLDWSGTLQGAGGVGGLLHERDVATSTNLRAAYDGNGNLMGLVSTTDGSLAAAYEYDAFGQTLRATGALSAGNPIRFSTKYADSETGLVYYGLRYYSPSLGRFINKDPIEEQGGLNLYAFCGNNGVNYWDVLGRNPATVPLAIGGAIINGTLEFGFTFYYSNKTGAARFWEAGFAGVGGVVSGAITGAVASTGVGLGTIVVWGGAANGIGEIISQSLNTAFNGGSMDERAIGASMAFGALGSVAEHAAGAYLKNVVKDATNGGLTQTAKEGLEDLAHAGMSVGEISDRTVQVATGAFSGIGSREVVGPNTNDGVRYVDSTIYSSAAAAMNFSSASAPFKGTPGVNGIASLEALALPKFTVTAVSGVPLVNVQPTAGASQASSGQTGSQGPASDVYELPTFYVTAPPPVSVSHDWSRLWSANGGRGGGGDFKNPWIVEQL